jgi:chromosome segregation ATPase
MGNSIKIKLVPSKDIKLYKPQPDFADLYVLMNKLHINSVNVALEENKPEVSDLEFDVHKYTQRINDNYKDESAINIMVDTLEKIVKTIKKDKLSQKNTDLKALKLDSFNKIFDESDSSVKDNLKKLDLKLAETNIEAFVTSIDSNIKILQARKEELNADTKSLSDKISRLDTLKENINSSKADLDSLEVALKNVKLLK